MNPAWEHVDRENFPRSPKAGQGRAEGSDQDCRQRKLHGAVRDGGLKGEQFTRAEDHWA